MDLQGKSRQELTDMLIKLAASMTPEDLEQPENFALTAQLIQMLDPKAEPLPQELVDDLSQIKDKADRFRQAAMYIGAMAPDKMERLKESMKAAGLLKAESETFVHEGYTFKAVPHEKTPVDHQAFEITDPQGKKDTLFARNHKEISGHISNEILKAKRCLKKNEPKVVGSGFGPSTPGPKILDRDTIKVGDVHAVTQHHEATDTLPAHKSQNLFRVTAHETSPSGNQDVVGHFVAHDDHSQRKSAGKDFPLRFGSKSAVNPHVDFHHVEQAQANTVPAQAAPTAGPVEENTPKATKIPKVGIKKEKIKDVKDHAQHKFAVNASKENLAAAATQMKSSERSMNSAINSADEFPEHKGREQKMMQKKQAYAAASENHIKAHQEHLTAVKAHLAFLQEKLGKSELEKPSKAIHPALEGFMKDWHGSSKDSGTHLGRIHNDKVFAVVKPSSFASSPLTKRPTANIDWLQSTEQGTGAGSHTLKHITDLADKHGVHLDLSVGSDVMRTSPKPRLKRFYKRHDFTMRGDPKKSTSMSRAPKLPIAKSENPHTGSSFQSFMDEEDNMHKSESLNEALNKAYPTNFDHSHIAMFPVSIRGSKSDPHNPKLPDYHVTLKFLGEKGPKADGTEHHVGEVVARHNVTAPKAEDIRLKPHKFTSPTGDVHHVLLLDGAHPEMSGANKELQAHNPDRFGFLPHITVSKELHDEVKEKGLTAKDLDLKVHPLEYRVGNKAVKTYAPKADEHYPPMKMAKAEPMKKTIEELKKAIGEVLEKRSKNVRRELARINAGKGGEEKTVARETKYMKDKVAVDETHSLPSEGDLAEKHFGDRKATDKLTNDHKKAAGWKANANGDFIRKPEIKQEGEKLSVTHMPTPKSVRHETAHAVRATGSLPALNQKMQGGYGKIKSAGAKSEKEAGLKAKASGASESEVKAAKTKGAMKGNPHAWQGEYETNGIENSIARRTGSLPPRNTAQRTIKEDVAKYGKGPKDHRDAPQVGMNGARQGQPIHAVVPEHTAMESSVVRRDRESKQRKAATPKHAKAVKEARVAGNPDPAKMPEKGPAKMVHIASLSANVRPEIKEKVNQKLDTGEIKYDKKTKEPMQAKNIDAKINGREAGRIPKPSQMTGAAKPAKAKEPEQMSFKLAASEASLTPGMSYSELKKTEKK